MAKDIAVGVVGCGGMGTGLASAVDASPLGRLVSYYDANPAQSAALVEKFGGRACASLEELLADNELQAVVVATPPHLHESCVVSAARAGKHAFVEKPMALGVAACDHMVDAAREAGVTLMVGQVLRYYEPFHSILRWSREGKFGRPFHACIQRVSGGWFARGTWRNSLATVGGTLYEVGAHELDFMRCLLGEASQVYVLTSDGERSRLSNTGTVDECKTEIINLLEGGGEAFDRRRERYGR